MIPHWNLGYAPNVTMKSKTKLLVSAGAIVVIVVFTLFAPIVTYKGKAAYGATINVPFTAQVSLSYVVFGCGEVYNPTFVLSTDNTTHQLYQGGAWQCGVRQLGSAT